LSYKTLNRKIGEICKRSLTNVQNTKDSETIHSHSQNSCSKTIAKRQTVHVNGNNGKITEIGQVKENTSNVPAIENEKNKHLDKQDHMTTIYASCLSDELVTHQREGLLDTSYEIKCHQCNEYILDAEPAIDCIQCTNWYHIKCTNEHSDVLLFTSRICLSSVSTSLSIVGEFLWLLDTGSVMSNSLGDVSSYDDKSCTPNFTLPSQLRTSTNYRWG
jgi:hypothetical protein